ncbi:glycosyltransferase [Bifidobacterium aerophilum]|uniref:Glycosyltransferase n=1 Tax=Bifidobacterium aerophilum TaxID=1798155 RepID=A0A6N9Z7U7_9BIFI|nr:glycosyltransferase [Bifidobacterium aerophilum]NEG90195.1 glycosyltransferase [Bifidobacterium aerophilum]
MPSMRFADIVLETNTRALSCPGMYCKADKPVIYDEDAGAWSLHGAGIFDFSTYFNALSVQKLRRYTRATGFRLHLELRGSACEVIQTVGRAYSVNPEPLERTTVSVAAGDEWRHVELDLSERADDVVLGFMIRTNGPVLLRSGYYEADYDGEPNPVELAIATTTFRKEPYIEGNISLLRSTIFDPQDEVGRHTHLFVIDNGRTLDAEALSDSHVTVVPNDNVGGSGGFARGMIMALEREIPATHVLLMDDDVAVSPESIRRTYALLRIVKDEYADAFVSGAMLDYDVADQQCEDVGYMTADGHFAPVKDPMRLTLFENIVTNELFDPLRSPKVRGVEDQLYAGWWYCCIPASQIRRYGLPLPLFVRTDDAEYALRCRPRIITMNGLCVWHVSFHVKYNAAVERYQTTRNTLVAQCVSGFAPKSDFMANIYDEIRLELKKFGYANAELCLDALEDFFKGPSFLSQPVGERCFMQANRRKEQLIPLDEVVKQAEALIPGFDPSSLDPQAIMNDVPRSRAQRLDDYLTDNHQRLLRDGGAGYAVIPAEGWVYPAGAIRGRKYIIAVDAHSRTGVIRVKDIARYQAIQQRYRRDLRYYQRNIERLRHEYAAAGEEWMSVRFWKTYLCM